MVGWIILAVLITLIALILLIPVGADMRYEEDGVIRISARRSRIPKSRRRKKSRRKNGHSL